VRSGVYYRFGMEGSMQKNRLEKSGKNVLFAGA
jgi:hypothetical protein